MKILKIVLISIVVLVLASGVCWPQNSGLDSLKMSEDFLESAYPDLALQSIDNALVLLKDELSQGKTIPAALARAHYTKAYILLSLGQTESMDAEIRNAISVDPASKPKGRFIKDPRFKAVYERIAGPVSAPAPAPAPVAAQAPADGGAQALLLEQAMNYYFEGRFCEAMALSDKLIKNGETSAKVQNIAAESREKCLEPVQAAGTPPPGVGAASKGSGIGLFPIFYQDLNSGIEGVLTSEMIGKEMLAIQSGLSLEVIPEQTTEELLAKAEVAEPRDLVVRNIINANKENLVNYLSKKTNKVDIVFGALPQNDAEKMKKLFELTGKRFLILVSVFSPVVVEDIDPLDIILTVNLYESSSPSDPLTSRSWTKVPSGKRLKWLADDVASQVVDELPGI